MKNLKIFMLLALGVFTLACDPLEDEIKVIEKNRTEVKDFTVTLSKDDYKLSSDKNVQKFGNFSNDAAARTLVPEILGKKYPALGEKSSAKVTYHLFNRLRLDFRNAPSHTITDKEYTDNGFRFKNLSKDEDIDKMLKKLYPNIKTNNKVVKLTYKWYVSLTRTTSTLTKNMVYFDGTWRNPYVMTAADYTAMGQRFTNFSLRSDAEEKIAVRLKTIYPFAKEGAEQYIEYTYTYVSSGSRKFQATSLKYTLTNGNWALKSDVETATLTFGHDGSKWVPDNTIKITLDADDFVAIAAATKTTNADGSASADRYKNFDVTKWTSKQILDAVVARMMSKGGIIKNEGQKYEVTFATWNPGAGTKTLKLIYKGSTFVEQQ